MSNPLGVNPCSLHAFMGPGRIARECDGAQAGRAGLSGAFMGPGRIARECGVRLPGESLLRQAFMGPGRIARECPVPLRPLVRAAQLSWGPDESPGNV